MNEKKQAEPNFPVFRGWPTHDERNPHIVRHLNVVDDNHIAGMPGSADSLAGSVAEFQTAYKGALATLLAVPGADKYREDLPSECPENWLPLAYRLQPVFEEAEPIWDIWDREAQLQHLGASKMGGIPDFRDLYAFTVSDARIGEVTGRPKPQQSVHQAIQRVWPRCANCHRHMRFVGQVRMSPWINSIYLSTNWGMTHPYGRHIKTSGLGSAQDLRVDTKSDVEIWYYLFFCDCGVHYAPHCNAHLMVRTKYNWGFGEDKKCLWDDQEYMDGILTQMDETGHDIAGKISLRVIKDMEYRFDPVAGSKVLDSDFVDAFSELPVFDYDHKHPSFFGEPRSQQDERRWYCINTFLGLHRQSPIIWWHDEEHDMDYQIYGCLRCMDHDAVYCKVDASCT